MPMRAINILDAYGVMQYEYVAGTCYRCNRIAGSRVFTIVKDKVEYVQEKLRERGICHLPVIPDRILSVSIVGRGSLESSSSTALQSTKADTGLSAFVAALEAGGKYLACRHCSRIWTKSSLSTEKLCPSCMEMIGPGKPKEICRSCKMVFTKIAEHQNICIYCAKARKGK